MSGPRSRDEIAVVVGEHRIHVATGRCACGWTLMPSWLAIKSGLSPDAQMTTHLADAILASDWLAERDRRTAAKTLREAADIGPINFAMTHEAPKWRGYNHLVTTRWLRDRADRIERGE